jgi:hypothetical protein
MAERRLPRGLLDPESQAIAEAYEAIPSVRRQTRGLLSLDPQEEQGMGQTAFEMLASFIPGVGQLLAGRDIERARRANDPAAAAMAATEFLPFGRLAGMMRRPGPIMSELDVYHGSPHRFEEFDASKIGTGEGAQAYGHGIYLAESPNVARGYREALSGGDRGRFVEKQGRRLSEVGEAEGFENLTPQDLAARIAAQYNGDIGKAVAETKSILQSTPKGYARDLRSKALRELQRNKDQYEGASWVEPGALYKADLPDEMVDRMLDWDKPLSEQSPYVQKIIGDEIKRIGGGSAHSGEQAYKELMFQARMERAQKEIMAREAKGQASVASPSAKSQAKAMEESRQLQAIDASERLRQLGIPGIKYLDAGSRGQGGSGTRNFVVFPGEEKKVKILKRE